MVLLWYCVYVAITTGIQVDKNGKEDKSEHSKGGWF